METPAPDQAPAGDEPEPKTLRLLVVEDHGDLCITLKELFAVLGHTGRVL